MKELIVMHVWESNAKITVELLGVSHSLITNALSSTET